MTTLNANNRQPTKLDYAEPTKFRFGVIKLPKVEYFCTAANIPGISLDICKKKGPKFILEKLVFTPSQVF